MIKKNQRDAGPGQEGKSDVAPSKLVIFTIGGKGGVGKSWFMGLLIDWYLSLGLKFHVIDLDNENNTLSRFYPEAKFIEVSSERDLDGMIEKIIEADAPLTLIDMRAASTDRIEPWLRKFELFESIRQEHGVFFTAIGVVDSSMDSVSNIGYWANDILKSHQSIRYVIAQNKVRGEELSYSGSKAAKEYRETLDLVEIAIPKLEEWIHQQLEVGDLRVSAALALNDNNNPLTKFMTKSRLRMYQQSVFKELEKARDRLVI